MRIVPDFGIFQILEFLHKPKLAVGAMQWSVKVAHHNSTMPVRGGSQEGEPTVSVNPQPSSLYSRRPQYGRCDTQGQTWSYTYLNTSNFQALDEGYEKSICFRSGFMYFFVFCDSYFSPASTILPASTCFSEECNSYTTTKLPCSSILNANHGFAYCQFALEWLNKGQPGGDINHSDAPFAI